PTAHHSHHHIKKSYLYASNDLFIFFFMSRRMLENKELGLILDEIQEALDEIKKKHKLKNLELGNTNYNAFSFTSKLKGEIESEIEKDFRQSEAEYFAEINDLPKDFINREFISDGLNFTIDRLETRNTKYPIIATCRSNDKTYKFTVESIKKMLNS
ncbi:MAG: hypothetical protein J7L96_09875, partial [Bacteroidales bacterium]|nr:hypothetical protein [Bacteroidales bacterium]